MTILVEAPRANAPATKKRRVAITHHRELAARLGLEPAQISVSFSEVGGKAIVSPIVNGRGPTPCQDAIARRYFAELCAVDAIGASR